MKREMIVCVKADRLNKIARNNLVDIHEVKEKHMMLGQREALENDPDFRQVLPINIFRHKDKIWAYRRSPSGGENRLHGKTTICVGGHWDLEDIITEIGEDSIVKWKSSIESAGQREIQEEILLGSSVVRSHVLTEMICSSLSDVDSVHLAVITINELDGKLLSSNEDQLEEIGFVTAKELLENPEYDLESWAEIILKLLEN